MELQPSGLQLSRDMERQHKGNSEDTGTRMIGVHAFTLSTCVNYDEQYKTWFKAIRALETGDWIYLETRCTQPDDAGEVLFLF